MPIKFNDAIDLNVNELQNVVTQNLSDDPGTGVVNGRLYYSTSLNVLRLRAGGAWTTLAQGAGFSAEDAQDAAASALGAGTHTGGIGVSYDDAGNAISITLSNNEAFQDIVGAFLETDTGSTGITATYDDANGRMNLAVTDSPLLEGQNSAFHLARANHTGSQASTTISDFAEAVSDQVGTMVTGNTESGITVAYDDGDNTLDFTVTDSPLLGGQNSAFHLARANHTGTDDPVDITFAASDRLLGRDTAGAGTGEEITVGGGLEFTGSGGIQRSALTGDVTATAGTNGTTIANSAVTNAKMADMAQSTIKGRAESAGTGAPVDLSIAQVKAILDYTGTDVAFTPAQNISATNVQAAIEEAVTDLTTLITTQIEARVWKDPVDAATTGALPAVTYNSGAGTLTADANGALPAQDGVTLAAGDALLVKNQASSFQGGIYDVTQVGDGGTPFILTRRGDANAAVELRDATVIVEGGTTGQGDIYTQTNAALADLTAAAQTWAKTGEGNTTYTADGTTVELVGNSFRIATGAAGDGLTGGGGSALAVSTGAGLEISGDAVRIAAAAAGSGLTGGGGSALDVSTGAGLEISGDAVRIAAAAAGNGLTGGAGSALAVGAGEGISVAADAVAIDRAVVVRGWAGAVPDGATTATLTHNLNTRDVKVVVYLNSGAYAEEMFGIERATVNTVTVRSAVNIPTGYRAVVEAIGG